MQSQLSTLVAASHYHQGYPRYGPAAGKNCTCNVLQFLISTTRIHVDSWTTTDIDTTLQLGANLYTYLNQIAGHTYFLIPQFPEYLELNNSTYRIQQQEPLAGSLSRDITDPMTTQHSLRDALQTAFQSRSRLFLTIGQTTSSYTIGLVYHTGAYFVFDSHSRDSLGMRSANGHAVLLKCATLNDLTTFIKQLAASLQIPNTHDTFEITPVNITPISSGPDNTLQRYFADQALRQRSKQKQDVSKQQQHPTSIPFQGPTNPATGQVQRLTKKQQKEKDAARKRQKRSDILPDDKRKEQLKDAARKRQSRALIAQQQKTKERAADAKRKAATRTSDESRTKERSADIQRKAAKRASEEYRRNERLKRTSDEYKTKERAADAKRKSVTRTSDEYRTKERAADAKRKAVARTSNESRTKERAADAKRKAVARTSDEYRTNERAADAKRKAARRTSIEDRTKNSLQQQANVHPSEKRQVQTVSALRAKEQEQQREHKRRIRKNPSLRHKICQQERASKQSHRVRNQPATIEALISHFHKEVRNGPLYICTSCNQLFYKHSVQTVKGLKVGVPPQLKSCLQGTISVDQKEWICHTCKKHLIKGHVPPSSIYNGMSFPALPPLQADLHQLELRLVSPRLPFMQIMEAPRGRQYKVRGNIVNVPTHVISTVQSLPRMHSDMSTIHVKLKRKLAYHHHVLAENIRPNKVKEAAEWLSNGPLYKAYNINFNPAWEMEEPDETGDKVNSNPEERAAQEPDSDDDSEDDNCAGTLDTMLTAPHFIEDEEQALVYNVAPGEGHSPLSIFKDKHSEELAFPGVFAGHQRLDSKERSRPVYYSEIVKSEIRQADRRAAKSIDNLFFKTKKLQMKQLVDRTQLAIRKCKKKGTITAGEIKAHGAVNTLVQLDEGYKFLKTLRGSPPFFEQAKKDLFAMIRQLGPATLFHTLSAAETRWIHLLRILGQLVDKKTYSDEELRNLSWQDKCHLIQSDPVTCARHFDRQVHLYINTFLKSNLAPLGCIQDFFYRIEFQQRGSPHVHMLMWIKDAPLYGEQPDDDIIAYIDSIMTCTKPTQAADPELTELVNYQTHRHSHTCRKSKKHKCRFGFPKPPMPHTVILTPLDETTSEATKVECRAKLKNIQLFLQNSGTDDNITFEEVLSKLQLSEEAYILAIRSSLRTNTVFLKRRLCDINTNNYNKECLLAWRANLDVQFILDTYACAVYVASYISKSSRGMGLLLRQACKEARQGDTDIRQQVRTIGNKFLNCVELSAQEAVYILLQMRLRNSSRKVVFVNTSPPEERVFLLKPMEQLHAMQDDDEDIQSSDMITRYQNRDTVLEDISLAEYIAYYDTPASSSKRRRPTQVTQDDHLPEQYDSNDEEDDPYSTLHNDDAANVQTDDQNKQDHSQESAALTSTTSTTTAASLPSTSTAVTADPSPTTLLNQVSSSCHPKEIKRRSIPRILRTVHFNKASEPEKHYRELLMLYTPWRDEDVDLLTGSPTFEQRYKQVQRQVDQEQARFEPCATEVDSAEQLILDEEVLEDTYAEMAPDTEQTEAEDVSTGPTPSNFYPCLQQRPQDTGETYDLAEDLGLAPSQPQLDIAPHEMQNQQYLDLLRSLNSEQMLFFYDVLNSIKTQDTPIYRFLSGGAGVGKSHLITAIYQACLKYYNSRSGQQFEEHNIILLAPTGKAAYNIKGNTIHSAMKIPASQKLAYSPLTTDKLNSFRLQFRHLKLIIIDEVSMVGANMLNFIHKRLQELMGNSLDFGGISIICVGDFYQLCPVFDDFIFKQPNQNKHDSYGILATNLWHTHFQMYQLTTIMRQRDSRQFAELLNRLREGKHTDQDIAMLQSRKIASHSQIPPKTPRLFLENKKVDEYNEEMYKAAQTESVIVAAQDNLVEPASQEVQRKILESVPSEPRKTMQLHTKLHLAVGERYDISVNVDVADGLANGASGVLQKASLTKTSNTSSGILWMHFDNPQIGQLTRQKNKYLYRQRGIDKDWTPIEPTTRSFTVSRRVTVKRTQFPLRPAAAKTIHRSQGDTLTSVVVDLTTRSRVHGVHYVALSRVKTIDGLYVLSLDETKIHVHNEVKKEMERLQRNVYSPLLPFLSPSENSTTILFHNCRSLHKYITDVRADGNLPAADILIFCETRFARYDSSSATHIEGFHAYHNIAVPPQHSHRPVHGTSIYSRQPFVSSYPQTQNANGIELTLSRFTSLPNILVVAVYRPPNVPLHHLVNLLKTIHYCHASLTLPTIIIGDFNVDALEPHEGKQLHNLLLTTFKYQQLIHRYTTDYRTALDHIYINASALVAGSGVLESYFSDHKPIWISIRHQ